MILPLAARESLPVARRQHLLSKGTRSELSAPSRAKSVRTRSVFLPRQIFCLPGSVIVCRFVQQALCVVIPAVSTLAPVSADILAERSLHVGLEHYAKGRIDEAITAYQSGLGIAAATPDRVPAETVAKLHSNLGNAYMTCGDLESAAARYKAALRLSPDLTSCWCNLGNVQLQTGNAPQGIAFYLQALKTNPAHWPSRTNLAHALMATKQHLIAKTLLLELAEERPHDAKVRQQLGKACFELNELEASLTHFQQALALNPADADSLYWTGALRQQLGDIDAAQAAYAQATQIQPLIRRRAIKSPPRR